MNIPEAKELAVVTLEPANGQACKAKLFVIEDEPGLWLLVRKSKRTTTKPTAPENRIAVFPTSDDSLAFGEFASAFDDKDLLAGLVACGLSFLQPAKEEQQQKSKPKK